MTAVPFVQRRRVRWGETDPAQIVYTPRFLDYAVEAVESWFAEILGIDWFRLRTDMGLGSPMAHASLDFHKPLFPHQEFAVTVLVENAGRSAIDFRIEGHRLDGTHSFTARLVAVIIDAARIRSVAMPADFRARIEAYRNACIAKGLK